VPNGFSPTQIKGAQALARGLNQSAAAREAGVARNTLILWLKKPEFRKKVDELTRANNTAETEAFTEVAKTRVKNGAVTPNELIDLFSGIVRDQDARLSDRIKAAENLARWLGLTEPRRYRQPPVLSNKPLSNSEMAHRVDCLKSKALAISEFLIDQSLEIAAEGDLQQATSVVSRALDLAHECTPDIAIAANTLAKEGFVVLTLPEYSRSLPDGLKSSPHLLQPLNFDRAFSWRWLKRQKSS
jgi:transposase-like protein